MTPDPIDRFFADAHRGMAVLLALVAVTFLMLALVFWLAAGDASLFAWALAVAVLAGIVYGVGRLLAR